MSVPKSEINLLLLARDFLRAKGLLKDDELALRFWRNGLYKWDRVRYQEVFDTEITSDFVKWLHERGLEGLAKKGLVADLLLNLKGMGLIDSKCEMPVFIEGGSKYVEAKNLLILKNGILDLREKRNKEGVNLISHTSRLFSCVCFNYPYLPKATCDTWTRFLEKIIPHEDTRHMLQEWIGYNLVFETSLARFAIFEGMGSNGKSVVCVVMRVLLGEDNISAVPLESFNASRTFPLAAMTGKLANIAEEMGELDRAAEGILKQIISGGALTVERKHCDPYLQIPTARLTFSTNILPRFSDRSLGIWRRMVLIPFRVQISEAEQDKRLIEPNFWKTNGELPGIFNWALEGYFRLCARGYFLESEICIEEKEVFQRECNPAASFLRENVEEDISERIPNRDLYKRYSQTLKESGFMPLNIENFSREVRRVFPKCRKTVNALNQLDGTRDREWVGIKFID